MQIGKAVFIKTRCFTTAKKEKVTKMSQRLILPITDMRITATYKNAQYKAYWGFHHYGLDAIGSNTDVYACGNGKVIACGPDGTTLYGDQSRLGNVIVIVYEDVLFQDETVSGLACRMFHFDQIYVQAGEYVTQSTVIGQYGNTGRYTTGPHLHIEFDTDTRWPCYAYGVASSGNIIKAGTIDSTKNANKIWYIGTDQQLRGAVNGWYKPEDINVPNLPENPPQTDYQALYEKEKNRAEQIQAQADACLSKKQALLAEIKSLYQKYE